jgi:hypothetical protein
MKIILFIGILCLCFVDILAEEILTCTLGSWQGEPWCNCYGSGTKDENVRIVTKPADMDVSTIIGVLLISPINAIPAEIFTKFPNLKNFAATGINLRDIQSGTFANGKKLETISLLDNALTFLPRDTFQGNFFQFHFHAI